MSRSVRVLLAVLGIVAVIVGIFYLVVPVHSLPSFFPGYAAHSKIHHHTRGYLAIAVGVLMLITAALAGRLRNPSHYR